MRIGKNQRALALLRSGRQCQEVTQKREVPDQVMLASAPPELRQSGPRKRGLPTRMARRFALRWQQNP